MRSEAKTKPRKRGFVFESQNDSKVMSKMEVYVKKQQPHSRVSE